MSSPFPSLSGDISSLDAVEGALAWWREAGVDVAYSDEAASWLNEPEATEVPQATPEPEKPKIPARTTARDRALQRSEGPQIGGERANWPTDLAAFREFWLTESTLDERGTQGRILPRGAEGAKLAVLVAQPEDEDDERLLSGPLGTLLAAITDAMGLAEGETYIASALPRPTPLPDWQEMGTRGLADLTSHHLTLAAPQRLLVFGRGLLPLLTDDELPPAALTLGSRQVPLMIWPRLDRLARAPGHRKKFWNDWLEWSTDA